MFSLHPLVGIRCVAKTLLRDTNHRSHTISKQDSCHFNVDVSPLIRNVAEKKSHLCEKKNASGVVTAVWADVSEGNSIYSA